MAEFEGHLLKLSAAQRAIVEAPPGPIMVVAGAGSGKTSVISHRFVHLCLSKGMAPDRILCLTFTNKAVKNMRDRIRHLAPFPLSELMQDRDKVQAMTFHAFCRMVIDDACRRRMRRERKVAHEGKCMRELRSIVEAYPHISGMWRLSALVNRMRWITKSERREFTAEDLAEVGVRHTDIADRAKLLERYPYEDMRNICREYGDVLDRLEWMTLDDILLDALELLEIPEVGDRWRSRFDAVMCDEFQDVDQVQFRLLKIMSSGHNNLFCVGDPDQSIYGFRGAMPEVFSRLKEHFESLDRPMGLYKLEENYRSTPEILAVANTLMSRSTTPDEFRKDLVTSQSSGPIPTVHVLDSPKKQAERVVDRLMQMKEEGVVISDVIVLGRNRSHYKHIKNELFSRAIGYEDWRELGTMLSRSEIKDLVGWLSVGFLDPKDPQDPNDRHRWYHRLSRVYARPTVGVGPKNFSRFLEGGIPEMLDRMERMGERNSAVALLHKKIMAIRSVAKSEDMSIRERCWKILEYSGLEKLYREQSDKLDTIRAFLDSPVTDGANDLSQMLANAEQYFKNDQSERVVCSTIHSVKGLEFPHVILVSLSEGNIPSRRGLRICKNPEEERNFLEEERRLMYVACTRAKRSLQLFTDKTEISPLLEDVMGSVAAADLDRKTMVYEEYEEEEDGSTPDEVL